MERRGRKRKNPTSDRKNGWMEEKEGRGREGIVKRKDGRATDERRERSLDRRQIQESERKE